MDSDKLTVTIIGLLPAQAGRVQSEYGDKLDLRFILTDTHISKIRATTESSDAVILMTKFIPHGIQTALRKHDGLDFCNGGISSVGVKLDEILKSQH